MTARNEKMVQLGEIIVATRKGQGWSQAMLADKAHVRPTTLSYLERGQVKTRPNPEILSRVLAVLELERRKHFEMAGFPIDDAPKDVSHDMSLQTILDSRKDLEEAVRLAGSLPADNDTVAVAISLIKQAARGEALRPTPRRRRRPRSE